MYIGFYVSVGMYPNTLTYYVNHGQYFWLILYFIVHFLSIYFFIFAGSHPGWVESDMGEDILENQNLNLQSEES